MAKKIAFPRKRTREILGAKMGASCPLGLLIRTQDSLYLARPWIQPYKKWKLEKSVSRVSLLQGSWVMHEFWSSQSVSTDKEVAVP